MTTINRDDRAGTGAAPQPAVAQDPPAERKPPAVSFASWVDQRITEAARRGAFDGLPGAGKPLPRRPLAEDGQAWLRDYLRREGTSAEELLPTPLKLRKEIERMVGSVQGLGSEQGVREVVGGLNQRIIEWRRLPLDGPPVFLPLVSVEEMVRRWRERPQRERPAAAPEPPAVPEPPAAPEPRAGARRPRRRRRGGR